MTFQIINADAIEGMKTLPDKSVQCCITSPPYWGLRNYGVEGQLGLEPTPQSYVSKMVDVFREVKRVLADDGTLWLNLGDSYSSGRRKTQVAPTIRSKGADEASGKSEYLNGFAVRPGVIEGLAGKQLVGIPWRVAFALQEDGWILRCDIIWAKNNPMPEPVRDRPTKSHEYLFLMAKQERYLFNKDAISEPSTQRDAGNGFSRPERLGKTGNPAPWSSTRPSRNARSVWNINTKPYLQAHFATFPPELPLRCTLAGSNPGHTILDPFCGSGTTGLCPDRHFIGIDLNPAYCQLASQRLSSPYTPQTTLLP